MLGIVKEINGQKTIIPLTTDAGTGAPVGTLIQQYKKKPMSGYLYCDGSTFDENAYPALYMYLGSNILPDYRECVMVGAEQNTTDTIAAHDVYTEGEFKDDQLQQHTHIILSNSSDVGASNRVREGAPGGTASVPTSDIDSGRTGETTHGKQKAVYVYIKATSGLAENQQDNVLNNVKDYVDNSNSYSTQEIKTGGTWIDGKPIYRKTLVFTNQTLNESPTHIGMLDMPINNIVRTEELVLCKNVALAGSGNEAVYIDYRGYIYAFQKVSSTTTGWDIYYTIEYTKTTD